MCRNHGLARAKDHAGRRASKRRQPARDAAEITKTRLGGLVVAPTAAEAEAKGRQFATSRGMDEERYRGYVIAGSPEQVREQVNAYLGAGLDGMIFNMVDAYDLASVRMAGEALSGLPS